VNARLRLPVLIGVIAVLAVACSPEENQPAFSGDIGKGNPSGSESAAPTAAGDAPEPVDLTTEESAQLATALEQTPSGCDVLDTRSCLLPFPSDAYTVEDTATATGRRVALPQGLLVNTAGQPLDPTEWNRNDGFSPSTPILVHVPGIDPDLTNLPTEGDIGMSVTAESATVIVDLDSGQLVPHWAEMDRQTTNDADRALILRPAISLRETHRFAVALRDLRDANGLVLDSPIAFEVLRDNRPTDDPGLEERREDYETVFTELAAAGVNRADLYLSWWFTVASADSLAGNVLAMRDDAFGRLAGGAPAFEVNGARTDGLQPGVAKIVNGSYEVPLYLTERGRPGGVLNIDPGTGEPVASGTFTATFVCAVPEQAVESGEAIPVVYGHGLLGSAGEAQSSQVQHTAAELNAVYCATNWIGLAAEDVLYAIEALADISKFPAMPDRMQQSLINTLYLGRLMIHEDGMGSDPEFQTTAGASLFNTESAYYDGNSQGAIMGGAVTAIAQDWTKASLGVGGMNYSTLLNRSTDFDTYAAVLRNSYPNALDQQIVFGILQMLWDRGETSGYVQHLTDRTYDLTPPKEVLMTIAFGDHQVANVTADNIARTLGIPMYRPALPVGATIVPEPFYDIKPIRSFPHVGSALYYWDSGTMAPPAGNITPRMSQRWIAGCSGANADQADSPRCADPHEDPRRQPEGIEQKRAFFQPGGAITNVCRDQPCIAKQADEFDY
jgi:hypothetical protein